MRFYKLMFAGVVEHIQRDGVVRNIIPIWRKIWIENNKYSKMYKNPTQTEIELQKMNEVLQNKIKEEININGSENVRSGTEVNEGSQSVLNPTE
jgi:hypothetical protein